jgi:ubiquinone/menaquinone biosynthesis C-methylase UbiE
MPQQVDPEGNERHQLGRVVDLRGARVLEIGCGDGRITSFYAPAARRFLGIDLKGDRLATALRARPAGVPASFAVADAQFLPCAAESCDIVLFTRSL